ncbi:MAG: hypothetical protein WCK95_13790 [Alphaproteobacteria bacterium]
MASLDGMPPYGTNQRIRTRAIWAVALFTASLPPAFIGFGMATATDDQTNLAMPLAFIFWSTGLLFALWAAVPTLRYWDGLPGQVRWLGSLPLLSVSLFLSIALIVSLLV